MPHRGISGLHAIVLSASPIGNRCKANPSPSAIKRQHPLPFFELNQMRNFRGINRLWIMLDKNAKLVYIIKEVCWCACSSVQRFYQPNTIILPTLIYCRYNYGRKI